MRYKPRKKKSNSIYRAPDPLIKPDIKIRKCLGPNCGKEFESTGPGNRICAKCSDLHQRYDRTYKCDAPDGVNDG